jgi:hypothetical protein
MQIEINKLQNEINEKMNYLKQAKNSIKDFIRDKVGNVISFVRKLFFIFIFIFLNLNKFILGKLCR